MYEGFVVSQVLPKDSTYIPLADHEVSTFLNSRLLSNILLIVALGKGVLTRVRGLYK